MCLVVVFRNYYVSNREKQQVVANSHEYHNAIRTGDMRDTSDITIAAKQRIDIFI